MEIGQTKNTKFIDKPKKSGGKISAIFFVGPITCLIDKQIELHTCKKKIIEGRRCLFAVSF